MRTLIAIALLISPFASEAKVIDWLKNIQIRKAFDGSMAEEKPGNVTFENTDPGEALYNIDLAAKFIERALHEGVHFSIYGYSSIEWHKSTKTDKEVNSLSGKGSIEIFWQGVQSVRLLAIGNAGWKHDYEKNEGSLECSALLSPYFAGGGPGSNVTLWNDALFMRYFPYAGYEFRGSSIDDQDLKTLLLRAEVELYPLATEQIQVLAQLVYRRKLNHLSEIEKNLWLGSIELNFYFDADAHFGVGFSCQNGRAPEDDFKKIKKSSIAFKLKF